MEEGTRFSRYLLLECLAADSVSETFLAQREDEPGPVVRQVALKRMKPEASSAPRWARVFLHEARVASQLRHPALPAVADFGESEGRFFVCSDYAPGVVLDTVLERRRGRGEGPLPWPIALRLGVALCEALQYASGLRDRDGAALGIVHRDISPATVLLTAAGGVRLLEYGLGCVTVRWHETREGALRTRLDYAAPELLRQEVPEERTDTYGIGVTLLEAVSGVQAFRRAAPRETVSAVMREKVRVADLVPETAPASLARLLQATLEKSAARRPSIAELREGLEECLVKGKGFAGGTEIASLVQPELPDACRLSLSAAAEEEAPPPAEDGDAPTSSLTLVDSPDPAAGSAACSEAPPGGDPSEPQGAKGGSA